MKKIASVKLAEYRQNTAMLKEAGFVDQDIKFLKEAGFFDKVKELGFGKATPKPEDIYKTIANTIADLPAEQQAAELEKLSLKTKMAVQALLEKYKKPEPHILFGPGQGSKHPDRQRARELNKTVDLPDASPERARLLNSM